MRKPTYKATVKKQKLYSEKTIMSYLQRFEYNMEQVYITRSYFLLTYKIYIIYDLCNRFYNLTNNNYRYQLARRTLNLEKLFQQHLWPSLEGRANRVHLTGLFRIEFVPIYRLFPNYIERKKKRRSNRPSISTPSLQLPTIECQLPE